MEPNPSNVSPWYLRNITQALALDEATGNVYVRTDADISIGNANITVGDVGITSLGNVDISGNTMPVSGNITVFQGTDPWTITGNVGISGTANVSLGATATDAFGRLRVSNPQTLFDSQSRSYDHGQFASNTATGGTITYDANSSTYGLNVTTASGSTAVQETYKVFPYQPGKSLLIFTTFCMNAAKPGLRQRVGYFGTQNGIFFEQDDTTIYMVKRSYSSGTVVETRVAQSSWNGDPLNGFGASGVELNPALDQIFWIDVEWLGVGSVRTGFVIGGQFIVAHTFNHANVPGNTTTYMTTACLPIRYEITNTGATGSASTLRQICASVISEGGYTLSGAPRGIGHALGTPVRLPSDASFKPVLAIRLKSNRLENIVLPISYTIAPVAQSSFKYRIYSRAVTTGTTWTDMGADSPVEYSLLPGAISSGTIVNEGFIISSNQSSGAPSQVPFGFEVQLQRDPFTATAYEYVITVATTGANQDVYASLEWQEVN